MSSAHVVRTFCFEEHAHTHDKIKIAKNSVKQLILFWKTYRQRHVIKIHNKVFLHVCSVAMFCFVTNRINRADVDRLHCCYFKPTVFYLSHVYESFNSSMIYDNYICMLAGHRGI